MKPKTVVLVSYFTSMPDRLTGISVYTFQILLALARRNSLKLVLLTNWSRDALPATIREADIATIHVATPLSEKLQFAHAAILVRNTARLLSADIIFTPHPFGALDGARARILVVHDLYRETHPEFYRWDRKLTWKLAFAAATARSNRIICVSEATRRDFCRLHPSQAHKAVTIHEASAARVAAGADEVVPSGRYALVVANATLNKNLECLLAALILLKRDGLSPPIYWVGRDDYGGVTTALARHPELDNFVPLGTVSEEHLSALYARADAYVTPSLTEGFCIPILEAQTFGVPVLCSDIPVLREVAGSGALVFDPRNPASIAAAIRQIWTDTELHHCLSLRARSNAARFSWDKAAAETEALFTACLASPMPEALPSRAVIDV